MVVAYHAPIEGQMERQTGVDIPTCQLVAATVAVHTYHLHHIWKQTQNKRINHISKSL